MGIFEKLGVLVANVSVARLYICTTKHLKLVAEFSHPEGRMKVSELVSDNMGQYKHSHSFAEGYYEPNKDPKEVEDEKFAAGLSSDLDKLQVLFNQIIIFAPAQFHGQLKSKLSKTLEQKLYTFVNKDYTKISEEELMQHIFEVVRP